MLLYNVIIIIFIQKCQRIKVLYNFRKKSYMYIGQVKVHAYICSVARKHGKFVKHITYNTMEWKKTNTCKQTKTSHAISDNSL